MDWIKEHNDETILRMQRPFTKQRQERELEIEREFAIEKHNQEVSQYYRNERLEKKLETKILNVKTGKYVLRTGKIGKQIIKELETL